MTRERIRQIEAKALRKLKHPSPVAEDAELPGSVIEPPSRRERSAKQTRASVRAGATARGIRTACALLARQDRKRS